MHNTYRVLTRSEFHLDSKNIPTIFFIFGSMEYFSARCSFLAVVAVGFTFLYFIVSQEISWKTFPIFLVRIMQADNYTGDNEMVSSGEKKLILSWTKYFGRVIDKKFMVQCPGLLDICELTHNQSRYSDADAIVFYAADGIELVPANRSRHHRHVLLMMEAPATQTWHHDHRLQGFFNWTMTFRLDSDVPRPYSHIGPDPNNTLILDTEIILNKTKALVWFVSNCHTPSRREQYVAKLMKYIPIDIFGGCGTDRCPKIYDLDQSQFNYRPSPCERELINEQYKFYLAFENSVCRDYVTEKFYNRWRYNSVPIVLSRHIVENILPPKSFIAADDFPAGPRQLADHLKFLMANDTEYRNYFEWKTKGYSETKRHPVTGLQWGFCGLCEELWRVKPSDHKVYDRIDQWWAGDKVCDKDIVDRLLVNEK